MEDLIAAIKSDLSALADKQARIVELLSSGYSTNRVLAEDARIEAVNTAYAMVPLQRDLDARVDGLLRVYHLLQQMEANQDGIQPTGGGQGGTQSEPSGTGEAESGDPGAVRPAASPAEA